MSFDAKLAVLMPLTLGGQLLPDHRSYVCALALALKHVNTRNAAIVPSLADLTTNFSLGAELFDTQAALQVGCIRLARDVRLL